MKQAPRHDEIVRLVHGKGEVSVDDLATTLQVSRETIRRDLTNLDAMGKLRKFHGGARLRSNLKDDPTAEGPFALRMIEHADAKRRIAQRAASLLNAGDAIFIDTGSATLLLAEALVNAPPLVIITNSWRIAATVAANADHEVFLIGGSYDADAGESLGQFAVEQVRKFRAQHAFLTVGAIDESAIMDFDAREAEIAQAIMERVNMVTVLADSSKFGKPAIFEVAPLKSVNRLICDEFPDSPVSRAILAAGIEVIIA